MNDELLRVAVGLPIAVLWPRGLPALARRRTVLGLAAGATAALVVAPLLPAWQGWVLPVVAGAIAAACPAGVAARPSERGIDRALLTIAIAVAAAGAAGALLVDAGAAVAAVRRGAESDDLLFVLLGALLAVFGAGAVIARLLDPLADRLAPTAETPGFVRAGLYIGWLERGLVFAFVVAGEPAAAALVLTAKSVARFPTFARGEESLSEYVLIGTLASFAAATLAAVATRGLLGLPAL